MNIVEQFCFWAGKVIIFIGGSGVVVTLLFDKMARGWTLPIHFGWLQWTGLIAFIALTSYGAIVDVFLNSEIKPMIEKYLEE